MILADLTPFDSWSAAQTQLMKSVGSVDAATLAAQPWHFVPPISVPKEKESDAGQIKAERGKIGNMPAPVSVS